MPIPPGQRGRTTLLGFHNVQWAILRGDKGAFAFA